MAVRLLPVPISISSPPTRDGKSFATASAWCGKSSVVVAKLCIDFHHLRHFQNGWFRVGNNLFFFLRRFRIDQKSLLFGFPCRLYYLLGLIGQAEVVAFRKVQQFFELFLRNDHVWVFPS